MLDTQVAGVTTLTIYVINTILLIGLVLLKAVHRRRAQDHDRRRHDYLGLLSRYVSEDEPSESITPEMAEDLAFLDALIDIREVISGRELEALEHVASHHGVIERQIRRLESPFPLGRRLRAAVALAEIGDSTAAGAMIRHLSDREPEIRIQCAQGLARIGWTPAIDEIVARFPIEIQPVRARFADSLVGFGTKATWPLLAYVRVNHRAEEAGPALALRTVGRLRDHSAAPPILQILSESDSLEVDIAAVEALGVIGNPESLDTLQTLLDDDRWQIRAKAATALGGIPEPSSIPLLTTALRDLNWWVRRNSAGALTQLPGGVDALYRALDDPDPYARDAAAEALADAGELMAARRRLDTGTSDDEPLLVHMGSED